MVTNSWPLIPSGEPNALQSRKTSATQFHVSIALAASIAMKPSLTVDSEGKLILPVTDHDNHGGGTALILDDLTSRKAVIVYMTRIAIVE